MENMERKRIGNDLLIRWAIFNKDGSPVDFNGKSVNVQIRLKGSKSGTPQEYLIEDNFINLQFTAKEQRKTGIYDLWLQYTWEDPSIEGGVATVTLDNCNAFELVDKSCKLQDINTNPVYLEGVVTGLSYSNLTQDEKDEITQNLANSGYWSKINIVEELPEVGNPGEFYATVEVV